MQSIINDIESKREIIRCASGDFVIIELKLRLLAEKNQLFRNEVHKQAASGRFKKYWDCELKILCSALSPVFNHILTLDQKKTVDLFKKPRDKMLHGDFVALMDALGVSLDGQEILPSGKRNQLIWPNDPEEAAKKQLLRQAIVRFCENKINSECQYLCADFEKIVDVLLRR